MPLSAWTRRKASSKDLDEGNVQLLRERSGVETDSRVKKEIATGLALAALDGSDAQARLSAISTLRHSLRQDVLNKLQALLEKSPDGTFVESDERVRQAAATAVKSIDRWRTFYSGIETLFFGLSLGSVLVLIAIGLAITFGVMGVINMAHGELMMLGAYTTYVVQMAMPNHTEISILVAIPAAFLVAALMGILIERTIIRFLYGRPLETLLATFGVSLILQQLVRSIFTALNRSVVTPAWMSGTLQLNDALAITYNRLYIVIFHAARLRGSSGDTEAHTCRSPNQGGLAESSHGQSDGHPQRVGRRDDLRARLGHRRRGRCGAEPVDQRRPEPGAVVHHRFVHGGRFWRRRESLGRHGWRHVDGSRQRTP